MKKTTKKASAKTTRKTAKKASSAKSKTSKKSVKAAAKPARAKSAGSSFAIGTKLPDFAADATSGRQFRLSDFKGKKVVLYFYPKDATPGCTIEGRDFTKLLPEFKKNGAEVYGISRDTLASHEKFKTKECFDFELLSDPEETLCALFNVVKEKNMYGRKVWGIERSTFVIDADGKLAAEWRGVKVPGHAQAVLDQVKSLG